MARIVRITAWPHIDPGKKRHKINIQAPGSTVDGYGQPSDSWTTAVSCYAAIDTVTVKEQFQDGFVSSVVHEIFIDWPGPNVRLLTNMRVVVNPVSGGVASVFEIQAIENVQQRNLIMRLTCIEINNSVVST